MSVCSVLGCGRPAWAIGMCSVHGNRIYRTGTTDPGPRARASLAERFWKYVERRGPDECWPWVGKSQLNGYGYIGRGGRGSGKLLSHRAVWELTYGPIPEGQGAHGTVVRHTCDNRKCCNPAHLLLGTQADNVRDMDQRGRRKTFVRQGPEHANARLTAEQVRIARDRSQSIKSLRERFGVSKRAIDHVRAGRTYRNVT